MGKDLSEMTLEELWELFPIFLVAHDDRWKDNYNEIEKVLTGLLADQPVVRISHIGSTAIQGIWAKNIVDVMVEISEKVNMEEIAHILEQNCFVKMSDEKGRISLNKGYTKGGFADKVYHIHLRYSGDNDELYFRDYLNKHPDVAKDYESLKLHLWKQYEHNRDAYTNAKTDFISKWTAEARKEYLELGTPVICEAAFSYYNNYCALDILRKTDSGYDIYEVKNAPCVYEQFIRDAGFQYYIVNRCKVNVDRIYIVTHGEDEENPFVINDVTEKAKGYAQWVNNNIWDLNRIQKEPEEVQVEPGEQCSKPYECWYYGYCHKNETTL